MPEIQVDVAALKDQVFNKDNADGLAKNEMSPIAQMGAPPPPAQPTEPTQPSQPPETKPEPQTPAQAADEVIDINDFIKQNFGVDNLDVAKQRWDALTKLEANPTAAEIKFSNDFSKKIYEYIQKGEEDKIFDTLNARKTLKDIQTMTDEQKLKTFIKMNNPLYDQELIDFEYSSNYGFDESKFKDPDTGSIIDPLGLRMAKVRAEQKKINDISNANNYFSQFTSKADLPEIKPPVDESYASYQAFTAEADKRYNQVVASASQISEKDVPLSFKFNDEASKLAIDINIEMDKAGFDAAKNYVLNNAIIDDRYFPKDGSPLVNEMIKDVYWLQKENRDKAINEVIIQAVNAERKRQLASQKNYSEGIVRTISQSQPSEIDTYKAQVFGK